MSSEENRRFSKKQINKKISLPFIFTSCHASLRYFNASKVVSAWNFLSYQHSQFLTVKIFSSITLTKSHVFSPRVKLLAKTLFCWAVWVVSAL